MFSKLFCFKAFRHIFHHDQLDGHPCVPPVAGPEEVGGVEAEERGGEEELESPAAPAAQVAPDCRGGELPCTMV